MDTELPRHVGYIIDGNRRWAKRHGLPAYEGHLAGYASTREVVLATFDRGVQWVSIYNFSTENWKRSRSETTRLMKLAMRAFTAELPEFIRREIRVVVLGTHDGLNDDLVDAITSAQAQTAHFTERTLAMCFNYGGQREIVDAVRQIVADGLAPDEIDEAAIASRLYQPDVPPCDLIVRTSGEQRLSNYMLWRSSYSELLFLEKCWPDMRADDVTAILEAYAARHRRYGG